MQEEKKGINKLVIENLENKKYLVQTYLVIATILMTINENVETQYIDTIFAQYPTLAHYIGSFSSVYRTYSIFILTILLYTMSLTKDYSGPTLEEQLSKITIRNDTIAIGCSLIYILPELAINCSNILAIVASITFSSIITNTLNSINPPSDIMSFIITKIGFQIPIAIVCATSLLHKNLQAYLSER